MTRNEGVRGSIPRVGSINALHSGIFFQYSPSRQRPRVNLTSTSLGSGHVVREDLSRPIYLARQRVRVEVEGRLD